MKQIKPYLFFDTFQIVSVHEVKLGILHRTFQIAVLCYIFIYSIYIAKGYQEKTDATGVLFTKVKGVGAVNQTNPWIIFDSTDLIIPPEETDALFILTSFVDTKQTRGNCISNLPQDICYSDANCTAGTYSQSGVIVNECNITAGSKSGFCTISSWCPLENDTVATAISNVENLSIFLRSSVIYEKFNILKSDSNVAIQGQNLFFLYQIVGETVVHDCILTGCIIQVLIDWTCDLDKQNCNPVRSYQKMADGFNYRRADYIYGPDSNIQFRQLQKLYGIRLLFKIIGTGAKFTVLQLIITIGSGLAFMSVATLIVDTLMIFIYSKNEAFRDKKYLQFAVNEEGGTELA